MIGGKESLYREMGAYFQKCREGSGLTQKELSEKLGYSSPQFVSNCERGQCTYPDRLLPVLARETGFDINNMVRILVRHSREYYRGLLQ